MTERKKVLIVNRGEVANSAVLSFKELGLETVVLWVQNDPSAHIEFADKVILLPDNTAFNDYELIVSIAKNNSIDYVYTGYGFLSENYRFVSKLDSLGIKVIGPDLDVFRLGIDKISFTKFCRKVGVNVLPTCEEIIRDYNEAKTSAEKIGYPVVFKSNLGQAGKSFAVARDEEELQLAFMTAQRDSTLYFESADLIVQKYLDKPRLFSVTLLSNKKQVFVLPIIETLFLRRQQKIISAFLEDENIKDQILKELKKIIDNIKFSGLLEIEFLEKDGEVYVIEMNPRLPTEYHLINALLKNDIIKLQYLAFLGEELKLNTEPVGYGYWFKIYAENPFDFVPMAGHINSLWLPQYAQVRWYSTVKVPCDLPVLFEALLGVTTVVADSKQEAKEVALKFLNELKIEGIATNQVAVKKAIENEIFNEFELVEKLKKMFLEGNLDDYNLNDFAVAILLERHLKSYYLKPVKIEENTWQLYSKVKKMLVRE